MKRYFVYVGYYEVFITTKRLAPPYFLSSRHKSVELATERVERDWPSASVYYDEESYGDFFGEGNNGETFTLTGVDREKILFYK